MSLPKAKEKAEALAAGADTTEVAADKVVKTSRRGVTSRRGNKDAAKPAKVKRAKTKAPKTKSAATRSVRNRKR